MDLREVSPGMFFAAVARPPGAAEAFPFRVVFSELHAVDSRVRDFVVHPHRHFHFEFILVERGPYHCRINGELVDVPAGAMAMITPGDRHEDQCRGPVKFHALTLMVLPGPGPDESARLLIAGTPPAAQVVRDAHGVFSGIIDRLGRQADRDDPFCAGLLDTLAFEFIWEMLRAVGAPLVDPQLIAGVARHTFAAQLQQLFARHLHHQLGLSAIAKELGISERSLSARCRAELGASPTRLFVRHKMERARNLLAQTDLPIAAISAYLGFENPYHFSTVYKRVHGVAPTKHRG